MGWKIEVFIVLKRYRNKNGGDGGGDGGGGEGGGGDGGGEGGGGDGLLRARLHNTHIELTFNFNRISEYIDPILR